MPTLDSLSFSYGDKRVIKELSFPFPKRGVVALVGPSGCGKTTLLHILAGLLKPTGGSIKCHHQRVAMAFQEPRLISWLNSEENIRFVLSKDEQSSDFAEKLLGAFSLSQHKNSLPEALSGGEQQRLSLARALAAEADLLLLDEPFTGLDNKLKQHLAPLILEANKEGLTVITTHHMEDAALLGAAVLLCEGTPLSALSPVPLAK